MYMHISIYVYICMCVCVCVCVCVYLYISCMLVRTKLHASQLKLYGCQNISHTTASSASTTYDVGSTS
jgi:hypothetical protein